MSSLSFQLFSSALIAHRPSSNQAANTSNPTSISLPVLLQSVILIPLSTPPGLKTPHVAVSPFALLCRRAMRSLAFCLVTSSSCDCSPFLVTWLYCTVYSTLGPFTNPWASCPFALRTHLVSGLLSSRLSLSPPGLHFPLSSRAPDISVCEYSYIWI